MQRTILLLLATIVAVGAAQAEDKFQRKSGLWELKRTSTRNEDKVRIYQLCVDQASDNALHQLEGGMRSETCETNKTIREGDRIVVDATCKVAQTTTAKTHAVITGTFETAYKLESKSTFDPPLKGKTEGSTVMEAKWTGACKANQKPGDLMLPNGTKVNIASDDKGAAAKDAAAPRDRSDKKAKGMYRPAPVPTK